MLKPYLRLKFKININSINSMNNYDILRDINANFEKLLSDSESSNVFISPSFDKAYDIDALIVLNEIIDIILQTRNTTTQLSRILGYTLNRIISIKCKEFIQIHSWNSNQQEFVESFYVYINSVIDSL